MNRSREGLASAVRHKRTWQTAQTEACVLQGRQFGHLQQGRKLSLVPVKSQSQRVLNKTVLSYSFSERLENKNTQQATPSGITARRHATA